MNKLLVAVTMMFAVAAVQAANFFGTGLCAYPQYECIKAVSGQSWETLFPDPVQRDLVQRVNRSYNQLWTGRQIAVPRNLAQLTLLDVAPFPLKMSTLSEKEIIVDQDKLAWAAYDKEGNLLNWGPISSGRDKCSDSNRSCRTMTGIFRMFSKENEKCKSDVFPIGKGGAKMPYCMYFHKGFAMHGSDDIRG